MSEVAMAVQLLRRRFTVAEYHKMAEAGILSEDDRVELLEGEIVAMSPIGSRHAGLVNRLTRLFSQRAGDQVIVSVQNPIRLGEHSEPHPDLALLRPRADFYASSHPGPEDVLLIVEVADTSAAVDREVKVPLYARWGVPEVWVVDLGGERVEVYRQPGVGGYEQRLTLARGDVVSPQAFSELRLAVADLLG
jgi:Uma2 family endonuclease